MNRRQLVKALGAVCVDSCVGWQKGFVHPGDVKLDSPNGQSGPQQFYSFSGSPYQVGYQHGKALREEIIAEAGNSLNALSKRINRSMRRIH